MRFNSRVTRQRTFEKAINIAEVKHLYQTTTPRRMHKCNCRRSVSIRAQVKECSRLADHSNVQVGIVNRTGVGVNRDFAIMYNFEKRDETGVTRGSVQQGVRRTCSICFSAIV